MIYSEVYVLLKCPIDGVSTGKVNEDVESRFQHLASSLQNDGMQLNRAMEASLDCKSPLIGTFGQKGYHNCC